LRPRVQQATNKLRFIGNSSDLHVKKLILVIDLFASLSLDSSVLLADGFRMFFIASHLSNSTTEATNRARVFALPSSSSQTLCFRSLTRKILVVYSAIQQSCIVQSRVNRSQGLSCLCLSCESPWLDQRTSQQLKTVKAK
jgi:hypothetical protein